MKTSRFFLAATAVLGATAGCSGSYVPAGSAVAPDATLARSKTRAAFEGESAEPHSNSRHVVRKYRELDDASALELLASSWHEERLVALLLLVRGYRRGDESRRTRIHRAYLANTRNINNWDLAGTI